MEQNVMFCPHCGSKNEAGSMFCAICGKNMNDFSGGGNTATNVSMSNIFGGIKAGFNKQATDLFSIKSNFGNGVVIYMNTKVPNIKEKKINVENGEVAYFNQGGGFTKYTQTFTTDASNFLCFWVHSGTKLFNNMQVNVTAKIMKVVVDTPIHLNVSYSLVLNAQDIDKFFYTLMNRKQNTWTELEINALLSENLRKIISDTVASRLVDDGNLDLRNIDGQLKKYNDEISELIQQEIDEYGLGVENFYIVNVDKDLNEINKVLIDNLYKE